MTLRGLNLVLFLIVPRCITVYNNWTSCCSTLIHQSLTYLSYLKWSWRLVDSVLRTFCIINFWGLIALWDTSYTIDSALVDFSISNVLISCFNFWIFSSMLAIFLTMSGTLLKTSWHSSQKYKRVRRIALASEKMSTLCQWPQHQTQKHTQKLIYAIWVLHTLWFFTIHLLERLDSASFVFVVKPKNLMFWIKLLIKKKERKKCEMRVEIMITIDWMLSL